jgi:hypothetical protein
VDEVASEEEGVLLDGGGSDNIGRFRVIDGLDWLEKYRGVLIADLSEEI